METDIVILGKGDAIVCMVLDNLNSNGVYGNITIYNNLSLPILREISHPDFNLDVREEIETHLKNFNVIQEGTIIPLSLSTTGEIVDIYVEKVLPEKVAILRDEVVLNLIETFIEPPAPVQRQLTPIPEELEFPLEEPEPEPQPLPLPQPQPDLATRRALMAAAALKRLGNHNL